MMFLVQPDNTKKQPPFFFCRSTDEDEVTTAADSSINMQHPESPIAAPVSLEGCLQCRMGKSSGQSVRWKRRFVYFSFADGGSITVYKESPNFNMNKLEEPDDNNNSFSVLARTVYSKLARNGNETNCVTNGMNNVDFDITADLPWEAKDVKRDSSTFVIEIPTGDGEASECSSSEKSASPVMALNSRDEDDLRFEADGFEARSEDENSMNADKFADFKMSVEGEDEKEDSFSLDDLKIDLRHDLGNFTHDLSRQMAAARKKKKPLRIYFRCEKGSNEKALWLRAFAAFGRLSSEHLTQKKGLINTLTAPLFGSHNRVRIRDKESAVLARDTRNLDLNDTSNPKAETDNASLGKKEFRVLPTYAYPHQWMTQSEMHDEMILPSEHFHDLRVPGCKQKEIGSLKVEVLQCVGLPKLDRASDTDAVVYLVCGSYSFCTDVIPNRKNPIWLRKSRRACNFPLFHGYASLYVGVFDNEARQLKDDFAGRVEINLAKLRPRSVYDVTLPLRLSTHVYSRRKRGAVRLRFCLNWTSEFDALMSYIPKRIRIPLPQNSVPNFDVTVGCTDPKGFRNIAITVHGAHLPGRFTFIQMRAAIREINFTRKYIFTAVRQWFRDLRHWKYPAMSSFVFFSWMHCIYANQFSLAPAYLALYFLIILMCNYVRYNTDGPGQRGFIPPSWEELFAALIRGKEPGFRAIEPLDLVPRKNNFKPRRSPNSAIEKQGDFIVSTHKPKGASILKYLGLIPNKPISANEDHLEFPFANGKEYPKFGVEECLVYHKGSEKALNASYDHHEIRERSHSHDSNPLTRFTQNVDLHDIMRKDASGTKEFDEEEMNFNTTKAVFAKGKKATSKITTAMGIKTALNSNVVNTLQSGIDVGVSHLNYISNHMPHPRMSLYSSNVTSIDGGRRKSFFSSKASQNLQNDVRSACSDLLRDSARSLEEEKCLITSTNSFESEMDSDSGDELMDDEESENEEMDPLLAFPQQDIDIEGPNSGKKLTDDLAEIKDKMHELTWHLFDDQTYAIKNSNTVYFGDAKKPEKKRKKDVKKKLDKFLRVGQYSHSNPFVARVGMYVEPIIGSAYSFLCLFRAGFNVVTWQDPILTFWVSLFLGAAVIILFVFPWRLFLFVVGVFIVGPQNWAIRIMRERGHLPPLPKFKTSDNKLHMFEDEIHEVPTDVPIFTSTDRKPGNDPRNRDASKESPLEIHHVVVPYTPLIYQRCYDWPPEVKYAKVKREVDEVKRGLSRDYDLHHTLSKSSSHSEPGTYRRQRIGFRNRLRRRKVSIGDMEIG